MKAIVTSLSKMMVIGNYRSYCRPLLDVETDLSTLDMIRLAFLAADVDLETLESATLDGDFMLLNDISYWQIDEAALQETVETHFGGGQ